MGKNTDNSLGIIEYLELMKPKLGDDIYIANMVFGSKHIREDKKMSICEQLRLNPDAVLEAQEIYFQTDDFLDNLEREENNEPTYIRR